MRPAVDWLAGVGGVFQLAYLESADPNSGIGLAASGNLDVSGTNPSMFEPVHGSAPDITGRGIADVLFRAADGTRCDHGRRGRDDDQTEMRELDLALQHDLLARRRGAFLRRQERQRFPPLRSPAFADPAALTAVGITGQYASTVPVGADGDAASEAARFTVTDDFPTPPLPEPTAMMAFTPGRGCGVGC